MQLYKVLVVLLPLTPELSVIPRAMGWTCVRDAFSPPPTYPTKHSFVPKVPLLL